MELVLLIPVLVLLTVFVLWAGRGGRAGLTADLAAEEAATAAAVCCEDDEGGEAGREALVQDVLEARPGLGFLCIGGPRPNVPPEDGVGPDGFLDEDWLDFESGREAGGVGVLGVRFLCETDGAVAPLRGLFPTVTFHGQASEVVPREPRFIVGFAPTRVDVDEGTDTQMVFTVVVEPAFGAEVTLTYRLDQDATTAEPEDFEGASAFEHLLEFTRNADNELVGTVIIAADKVSKEISLPLFDDKFFEGTEELVLELTGHSLGVELDDDRITATGVIADDDPEPFLQIMGAPSVGEGGTLNFEVRVGNEDGEVVADIAKPFTVQVSTVDDQVDRGSDCDWPTPPGEPCPWATADDDYTPVDRELTFRPGEPLTQTVPVATLDDVVSPEGEETEYVRLVLSDPSPDAPRLHGNRRKADGTIRDDEATASIRDVTLTENPAAAEGDPVVFEVTLNKEPAADVALTYNLGPDERVGAHGAMQATGDSCEDGDDYLRTTVPVTIRKPSQRATFEVETCEDVLVERDETFWVGLSRAGGEVVVPDGTGALGTIRNDDTPVVSVSPATAEGTEGQTDPLEFTVSLTVDGQPAQLTEDMTVNYVIGGHDSDPDSDPATSPGEPGEDYAVTLDTDPPSVLSGATLLGTLTFTAETATTPAVTEHVFEVELLADHLLEEPETFQLDLSNIVDPVGAAVFEDRDGDPATDDSYAVGTIFDDPPPVISVEDFAGREGTTQSFTVSLTEGRAGETVTVGYAIVGGAGAGLATEDVDYEAAAGSALSGTLEFGPGVTSRTVRVRLLHDEFIEADERLRLTLSGPSQAVLSGSTPSNILDELEAVGTIINVDPPWIIVDNAAADEGLTLEFTITVCNRRAGDTVTVDYDTANRNAEAGRDYDAESGTLTFDDASPPAAADPAAVCGDRGIAAQSRQVAVPLLADAIAEVAERFHLVLSADDDPVDPLPLNAVFDKNFGVGTINNVNPASVVIADPAPVVEGTDLTFTVAVVDSQTGGTPTIHTPVTVHYATEDRTAEAPGDYTALSLTPITFYDGTDTRNITVRTRTDTDNEDHETLALILSDVSTHAAIGDTVGTGTIIDAPVPGIRVYDAIGVVEGGVLVFVVTLDRASDQPVTVYAHTEDITAQAPGDYSALARRELRFDPGVRRLEIHVQSHGDDDYEPEEEFALVLSGPVSNALIDRAEGRGTIRQPCVDINDDTQRPPTLTFRTGFQQGGEGSNQPYGVAEEGERMTVAFQIDQPLCERGSVRVSQRYTGAANHMDFSTFLSGVGFEAGLLERHLHHDTLEDTLDEPDEQFTIVARWNTNLMPPHYVMDEITMIATILDDDPEPNLRIGDASALEGEDLTFEVTLDAASGRTVTVQYRTVDGSAVAGVDYDGVSSWATMEFVPVSRGAGTPTRQTITVRSHPDGDDVDDTFAVELRNPVNASIGDTAAVGTILEGGLPEMRIFDAAADEGEVMSFEVVLSEPAPQPITVDFATVQRPAGVGAATAGTDYTHMDSSLSPWSPLTFDTGEDSKTIEVPILGDDVDEPDETFFVELSGAVGASLADRSAVGTINGTVSCVGPGDPAPTLTIDPASATEGDDTTMRFTLTFGEPFCDETRMVPYTEPVTARRPATTSGYATGWMSRPSPRPGQ